MTARRPSSRSGATPVVRPGERLVGVDVARALALFGMMAAHVGDVPSTFLIDDASTWPAVVNGRSSTLFAVLAGVSIALVSGRTERPGPPQIGRVRRGLALRAVVVVVVGILLVALDTPVYVILPTYGVLFLLALPVVGWPRRSVLIAAALCALLSVPAAIAAVPLVTSAGADPLVLVYPVVTFLAYVLVGLAVGRSDLTRRAVQWTLLAVGVAGAVVSYTVGTALAPLPPDAGSAFPGVPWDGGAEPGGPALAQEFLSPRDHSSSIVDVVGTAGIAVAVIALCALLFAGRAALAAPLAAVGAMPLSVYALHLVVIAVTPSVPHGVWTWAAYVVGAVVFATVWRRLAGRGPLERLTARIARS